MPKTTKQYRLTERCLERIEAIKERYALPSATSVIEFSINATHKEIKSMQSKKIAKIKAEDNNAWITYRCGTTTEAFFQGDSLDEEMEAQGYAPLDASGAELVGLDLDEAETLWVSAD